MRSLLSALAALALVVLGISLGATGASADPTYSISGTVTDASNAAVGSLELTLSDSTNTPVTTTTTNSDGTYSFPGLPAGAYSISTRSSGYQAISTTVSITTSDVVLDLVDPPVAVVSGTITMGGSSANGVSIQVIGSVGGSQYAANDSTDADGHYSITVPAASGGYTFSFASGAGARLAITAYDFGSGATSLNNACRLEPDATNQEQFAAGGTISLDVALNPDPAACDTVATTPPTPQHHGAKPSPVPLAITGTVTPTATPTPTESASPSAPATATTTESDTTRPLLSSTSSTGPMPAWGWLLVALAVLLMLGGVGFTVVRHR